MTESFHAAPEPDKKQQKKHFKRPSLRSVLITAGIAAGVLLLIFLLILWYLVASAPDIDSVTVSPEESATYICDQEGNPLRKLTLSSSNRDIVSLDQIPEILQEAVIAIEDERFYSHGGIDLKGISRALWRGITRLSFSEGASTITQQLIKNSVFTEWTSETSFWDRFSRKIQEQYLALQLENRMSKEEILENYLNTINLGAGCYGVQAASLRYFGKDVKELTLTEASVLAAIPQNPTAYNPITNPEKNQERREIVLDYMEEQGYITEAEKKGALSSEIYNEIAAQDEIYEETSVYSYYEDALIDQVMDLLMEEKGYSSEQAYRAVFSGGLRIFSAQDSEIQEICDEEFLNEANFPAGTRYGIDYALSIQEPDGTVSHYGPEALRSYVRENLDSTFDLMCDSPETAQSYADAFRSSLLSGAASEEEADTKESEASQSEESPQASVLGERLTLSPQPQASAVIIEQETGLVRAIVGGRGEKTASLTLNRATETTRQPGSTFKIPAVYAPALDARDKTLAALYDNEPYAYEDGTPVSNWDLSDYTGPVTIREAITRSINVVAVRCITEITPHLGFEYAENMGISTLHETYEENGQRSSDIIQPLALGGITQGVTNLELCGAYASIADGGVYRQPLFFTKILDRNGNVVLDYEDGSEASSRESRRVMKETTAYLLTDAMKDVVSQKTGTAYGAIQAGTMPVAGKTGTTSSYKDIWFTGYTPFYTCSVWGGYDNNASLQDGERSYNKTLWSAIMTRVHETLPNTDFSRPEGIVTVTLCSRTHLPAVEDGCPETYKEVFAKGTVPEEECPLHEPKPETEQIQIYPDILEELLTESESEKEEESQAEEESRTETSSEFLTETEEESLSVSEETERETVSESESLPDSSEALTDSEASPQTETLPELYEDSEETSSLDDLLGRLGKYGLR